MVQHHLHPLPHPLPIPLELIDGSLPSTGPITHYLPSRIRIHGSHTEDLTFQITRLGHFPLVLGFPWLARHNPCINWHTGTLTFASSFCSSSCLSPPLPSPPPPPPAPSSDPPPLLSLPPSVLAGTSAPLPSTPPPHPNLFKQVSSSIVFNLSLVRRNLRVA